MWKWARLALLGNTRSIRLVNFDTKASLSHINLVKIGPPDLQGAVTRVIGIWTILIRPQQLSLTEAGDDVAGGPVVLTRITRMEMMSCNSCMKSDLDKSLTSDHDWYLRVNSVGDVTCKKHEMLSWRLPDPPWPDTSPVTRQEGRGQYIAGQCDDIWRSDW